MSFLTCTDAGAGRSETLASAAAASKQATSGEDFDLRMECG
jgi:hypothetical protein